MIQNIEDQYETMIVTDTLDPDIDGEKTEEIVIITDSVTTEEIIPPFQWQPG